MKISLLPHLLLLMALTACANTSRTVRFGDRAVGSSAKCQPRLFEAGERPAKFLALGRVEAESTVDESGLQQRLVSNACALNADALIDIRVETFDTLRSRIDGQTREKTFDAGPPIHVATALAILIVDTPGDGSEASGPAENASTEKPVKSGGAKTSDVKPPSRQARDVARRKVQRIDDAPQKAEPASELPLPPPPLLLD